MRIRQRLVWTAIVAVLVVWAATSVRAHNPCCNMASIGVPAAVITLDGVKGAGEWNGAGPATPVGGINPLNGTITVLHKADGVYFLFVVNDTTNNNNDAINIRFDILHNAAATPDADDFGVEILRNGQAFWGPAQNDPSTWGAVAAGTVGVTSAANSWIAEFHLPTGPPSNLQITNTGVGIYFNLYDADGAFGANSAKYSQWPPAPVGDPNALLDKTPMQWADLIFDPKTTFTDVMVTDVHRSDAGAANYYKLNYAGTNSFEADLENPGGTTVPDAGNVRINLYLAARGIGESWHRLDTNAILAADCAAPIFPSNVLGKGDVCSGSSPLPDISTMTINNVTANTAKYTIQNGLVMNRTGGNGITVPGVTDTYYPVIDWNTTPAQDPFFQDVTVGGTQYNRSHECMLAEAIVPNDPNPGNNTHQVNMDFIGVPGGTMLKKHFTLGWPGFGKYDPNVGNRMFLQVASRNADQRFKFELAGASALQGNAYVADLKGQRSLGIDAQITAPPADVLGKTLKENLLIPPRAGGAERTPLSGLPAVHVRVPANSVIWIVNYSIDDKDEQFVDLDAKGRLPHNGPQGLPESLVREPATARLRRLVPGARLGELVLSFDGFKTGVGIAEGVQLRTPPNATYASLAINDYVGAYRDNIGTGFRVKLLVRPEGVLTAMPVTEAMRRDVAPGGDAQLRAEIARLAMVSILDVIPQFCVSGYEDIHDKREIHSQSNELFRYIGNVCWGVLNVMQNQKPPADKGYPLR